MIKEELTHGVRVCLYMYICIFYSLKTINLKYKYIFVPILSLTYFYKQTVSLCSIKNL